MLQNISLISFYKLSIDQRILKMYRNLYKNINQYNSFQHW